MATSGGVSIALFGTVSGTSSARLSIMFSINNRIAKNTSTLRKKNEKHNKIVLSARFKFNNIENIISETLIDNEISREDFTKFTNEENSIINKKKVLE